MTKFLLSLHVLAAIVAIGPVTVAASAYPRYVRQGREGLPGLRVLHRICRVYAGVGIAVPCFGIATAASLGVLGDAWLIASMVITTAAAVVLVVLVLPGQEAVLEKVERVGKPEPTASAESAAEGGAGTATATTAPPSTDPTDLRRLAAPPAMGAGVFNLLWAVVVVLMIVRPGSTTGA